MTWSESLGHVSWAMAQCCAIIHDEE
jgi:hypothetical protein